MPFWSCETPERSNAVFISVFKAILHLCIETPGICEKKWSWGSVDHSKQPPSYCPGYVFWSLTSTMVTPGAQKNRSRLMAATFLRCLPGLTSALPRSIDGWPSLAPLGALDHHWYTIGFNTKNEIIHGWNWLDDLGIFGGNPHDLRNLHVIWLENLISLLKTSNTDLVDCLEHVLFFHLLAIIIPSDWYFSEGLKPPISDSFGAHWVFSSKCWKPLCGHVSVCKWVTAGYGCTRQGFEAWGCIVWTKGAPAQPATERDSLQLLAAWPLSHSVFAQPDVNHGAQRTIGWGERTLLWVLTLSNVRMNQKDFSHRFHVFEIVLHDFPWFSNIVELRTPTMP